MGLKPRAVALSNNEVAYIAWDVEGMIPGCLGFDIVRRIAGEEEKRLPTWVPFKGQGNPNWNPQDTGVWPVQKTSWRDLTLRRRRDRPERRGDDLVVSYRIRPVGQLRNGMEALPQAPANGFTGAAVPLGYIGDEAAETNEVRVTSSFDGIDAAFTNGILAGQWLRHAIESTGKRFDRDTLMREIVDPQSAIRDYLHGDVEAFLLRLLEQAADTGGKVHLALYELDDPVLLSALVQHKERIRVILSNSSADRKTGQWDFRNRPARDRLRAEGVDLQSRLFNNRHIGHNKFAVLVDGQGRAQSVLTGSTNWTALGLCGQSNNAVIVNEPEIAAGYLRYWQRLEEDVIPEPAVPGAPGGANVQSRALREGNLHAETADVGAASATLWCSPNTILTTRNVKKTPPDLAELFSLIDRAQEAVFFLAFLPSRGGLYSIIEQARAAGEAKPNLLVVGAISDPTAMPGYVARTESDGEAEDETPQEAAARKPYVYDERHTHIVRAAALGEGGALSDFEAEILTLGTAIVHDKIVVIDPLSQNCVVATGSHNLGYKASYENDENLLVVRGNQALAKAYAVHVLDVYDHYRFRAWQAKDRTEGRPSFSGHIDADDRWLARYVRGGKGDIAAYFLRHAEAG